MNQRVVLTLEVIEARTEVLALKFDVLLERVKAMSAQLDSLQAQVTRCTSVSQSAVTLIKGLAAQIEAMKDDPAKLQALADELKGDADALGQSVSDNVLPTVP